MFGTQALRLLREKWPGAQQLAEELYAIFQDKNPVSSGPIIITNKTPGGPGLTVRNAGGSGDVINMGSGGVDTVNFTLGSDGGLIIKTPSLQTQAPDGKTAPTAIGGGGGVPGQVVSGGPGSSYQVQIYPAGLSGATKTVAATQLSIDAAETIPAGTWTTVVQAGTAYYMQVPVWGAP